MPLAPSQDDRHTQPADTTSAYLVGTFTAVAHPGNPNTPCAILAFYLNGTPDDDALLWPGDFLPELLQTDTNNADHQENTQSETQAASSTCQAVTLAIHHFDDLSIDLRRLRARSRKLPLHEPTG